MASQKFVTGYKWRHAGFNHEVVDRLGNVVIARKWVEGSAWEGWEVAIVKPHDEWEIAVVRVPPGECCPSTTQWGALGWIYCDEMTARRRFLKEAAQ